MKASDLLVECLEREGVEDVFGLPGEELEDLLFSLRDSGIRFVPVRHEQGAAFMADVHGRLTGEAGVCLATLGPGATNLLTGVADAHLDKSPLVAITGQGSSERLHKESHQALDVVDMFESVTKWNTRLGTPDIIHESVRKAFKLAEYEKPGATHLELPEDVAGHETGAKPLEQRMRVRRPSPDAESIERAAQVLADAERPLVLAGNGGVRTRSSAQLRALVRDTEMPVVATYMGKGSVSDASDHSLLTLDSGADDQAARTVQQADAVLAVGYDIAEHDPESWNPDLDKRIVHLDFEPAEVYEHYNPEVEVVADISASLRALRRTGFEPTSRGWYADLRESLLAEVTSSPDPGDALTVRGTLPVLRDVMVDCDVLVSDVGSHKMEIARRFPTYEPNTTIVSNGLASMGIAVPGAVAADLAVGDSVVAATGDGGSLMNAAELETAGRLDLGFTVLLFNDDDYGLISEKQEAHTGEHFGTELGNPDFVTLAESFGMNATRVADYGELREALERAVPSEDLALVEVPV